MPCCLTGTLSPGWRFSWADPRCIWRKLEKGTTKEYSNFIRQNGDRDRSSAISGFVQQWSINATGRLKGNEPEAGVIMVDCISQWNTLKRVRQPSVYLFKATTFGANKSGLRKQVVISQVPYVDCTNDTQNGKGGGGGLETKMHRLVISL